MRVAVHVLLHLECLVVGLELNGDLFVDAQLGLLTGLVVAVFHVLAGERTCLRHKSALKVDERHGIAFGIEYEHRRNPRGGSHTGVVGAKGGRGVHDAGSVLGRHEVARNHLECLVGALVRKRHRKQLGVAESHEVAALCGGEAGPGSALFISFEVVGHQGAGQNHVDLDARVRVGRRDQAVLDVRAHR